MSELHRKTVNRSTENLIWDFERNDTLIDAIEFLVELAEQYGFDAKFGLDFDQGSSLHIRYTELESEEDYQKRIRKFESDQKSKQVDLAVRISKLHGRLK